jgi:hypothetical protein
MTLRKRFVVVFLWVVSMFAAGLWGHAQAPQPHREPRPAPSQVQPQQKTVISGADLGFRVDSRKGNTPIGRLVVRIDGQWVEIEESASIRRLTDGR